MTRPYHMMDHVTEDCASHFNNAFAELAQLQRQGLFCDITLFVCEGTMTTSVASHGADTTGKTAEDTSEQVTSGSVLTHVATVKLGHIQEGEKAQEEDECSTVTDGDVVKTWQTPDVRTITRVHAHKVVLAACSNVLQQELTRHADQSEMLIRTSYTALSAIINYMYTGTLTLTRDSVDAVRAKCQAWHMPAAIHLCEQFEKKLQQQEAAAKQEASVTQQTDMPVRRTRGRPPMSQSATKVTGAVQSSRTDVADSVPSSKTKVTLLLQTPRTRSASLRSASPLPVKIAPKRTGRKRYDATLTDKRAVESVDSSAGVLNTTGSRTGIKVTGFKAGVEGAGVEGTGSRTGLEAAGGREGKEDVTGSAACTAEGMSSGVKVTSGASLIVQATHSNAGVVDTGQADGDESLNDGMEPDIPDNAACDDTPADSERGKEKSHAYSLRPEIKRRQDPDEVTPVKTRKVCRNIVLENVVVIKGTRTKKNVHYTKTPAEIGHIHKHGFHADYLDLSLFSDAPEQKVVSGKTHLETVPDVESVVLKDESASEKGQGAGSTELAQDSSSDVARAVQKPLKDDIRSKHLQDAAIPDEACSKKQGEKDHNYVVAQNDNLKQKGKQHGCRTCRRCHKRFRTTLQYRSHLDKCPVALACPRKHYHCRQCGVSFAAHTDYHKHRRMHIEISKQHKPYVCNQCDFKCRVETRLVEHMYRQHGFPLENSGFEVYVCSVEGCGYQSILRNVMKHHQTRHSQERPFMCEFCGTKFKSKVTLRTHTRIHTNERMFKCTYCDSAYIQRVGLLNHIKSKHERTNEFLCSQCPFVTSLKPNLQNHMFTAHDILPSEKTKVYKCEHCGLKTLRKSEYNNHMRRHSGIKSFACDVCSHKFYTQAEINNHKKRHLNNPPKHKCPYDNCNFAVFEKSKLQQHIRIRHTEKGLKPWTCYICDYRTDLKGNLTKHLRTVHHLIVHTNQKLCKVVSSTVNTPGGTTQMLIPTSCINVNDLHMSKMVPPVDVTPCNAASGEDPVDITAMATGYMKVKECDMESVCASPVVQSQGLMVGGGIGQAALPDMSRPLDTSNMRVIYSMTNLASSTSGMSVDAATDLAMSSSVTNLPVSSLTNLSMTSPSQATSTMPLTSLTPLPSISSSLGHLRHSTLAMSLPVVPPVNVPFGQCVPVTSNSDLMPLPTTTLTPLITHIPPPVPANIPPTGQAQVAKDGSIGMMPILHMQTDPNTGLYMYADNQLIPPQALSWEHASQDMTQYRQQTYK